MASATLLHCCHSVRSARLGIPVRSSGIGLETRRLPRVEKPPCSLSKEVAEAGVEPARGIPPTGFKIPSVCRFRHSAPRIWTRGPETRILPDSDGLFKPESARGAGRSSWPIRAQASCQRRNVSGPCRRVNDPGSILVVEEAVCLGRAVLTRPTVRWALRSRLSGLPLARNPGQSAPWRPACECTLARFPPYGARQATTSDLPGEGDPRRRGGHGNAGTATGGFAL